MLLLPKCYVSSFRLLCYCRLIRLLDRVSFGASSAATSGTSMNIDKEQDDEETTDVATSRAGTTPQPCLHFVNCSVGRLYTYDRVFCSTTKCY